MLHFWHTGYRLLPASRDALAGRTAITLWQRSYIVQILLLASQSKILSYLAVACPKLSFFSFLFFFPSRRVKRPTFTQNTLRLALGKSEFRVTRNFQKTSKICYHRLFDYNRILHIYFNPPV